jgi:monooxygenase
MAPDTPQPEHATDLSQPEHLDVLIIGAGLSGIGAGYHLQTRLPHKRYAILEARETIGGTWDLFRYPGIRSDSDMYTLSYPFRPWDSDQSIVDGSEICNYIQETAREYGIDRRIRFQHRVTSAEWSSEEHRWRVGVQRGDTDEKTQLTCSFLFACTGYYRYDQGYLPDFPDIDRFRGQVIHPQFWPQDVDYEGKRVVVIGSGATAVTLVPSLAPKAAHVTMLQRSPSYVLSLPGEDAIAARLRSLLGPRRAHAVIRWKNALLMTLTFQLSRRCPALVKRLIRLGVKHHLPAGYDVETHFKPRYNPWEQRLCLVRDADLFEVLGDGRASVVTDRIESFTKEGIRLASGAELAADLIVTATGLNLQLFGGSSLKVDGEELNPADAIIYRGCMLSGAPNLAFSFGYTNASWTLRCDLTAQYVCRLLSYMDEHGYASCTPRRPDPALSTLPFADFSSGYIVRSIDELPRQGPKPPWRLNQNYLLDLLMLKARQIDEPAIEFSRDGNQAVPASHATPELAAAT